MPFLKRIVSHLPSTFRYERNRQIAVVPVMAATDFFKRVFSTANPTVAAIRGLGVSTTNRFAPLKTRIIRNAMGI